jgi:formylglycine-generating enzyme required for sulfatase activity
VKNSIGQNFTLIPSGTFLMGSPNTENSRYNNEDQYSVTLTNSFFIQQTVVTQSQWKKVMMSEPWKIRLSFPEGDDYPAFGVSWFDALEFCEKLSLMENNTYRLPTEAEWEYACRGGTNTAFSFGDDQRSVCRYAWQYTNTRRENHPHKVAQKRPNNFGLYDMHGNVWEWCSDWYDIYPSTSRTDPRGANYGSYRVCRGGSWSSNPRDIRCAARGLGEPPIRDVASGFRLVGEFSDVN